jgi:kumamolisin
MTGAGPVRLAGSNRQPLADARLSGPADPAERIELTLVTRRAASLPRTAAGVPVRLSRNELRGAYGSTQPDQARVAQVLTGLNPAIEITSSDPGSRRMSVAGPAGILAAAFGTELSMAVSPGPAGTEVRHRYRSGPLEIPAELDGIVLAVLGLDTRPQATPQIRFAAAAAAQVSYTPPQVADIYQFPAGTDGTGHTIAIIELGGGFSAADLDSYFARLGIPVPSITAAGVDGAANVPDQAPQGADGEVLLDIEVAGSVAPGAAQVVYFAPNTDQGFVDAVTNAVQAQPTPVAVSISWGGPESSWTAQSMTALDEAIADGVALGVTITAAAGDNGSGDGATDGRPHADFPASSPHALACGGTSLQADVATNTLTSEAVWNDGSQGGATGGGVSATFGPPAWQASAGVPASPAGQPGRGLPDVAGNADPATGYQVLVDGQQEVIGGTSAVAPLWAALIARLAQSLDRSLGLVQPALYAGIEPGQPVAGLRDITVGGNGAYTAGPGWDACSGLGVPNGTALLAMLAGTGTGGSTGPAGSGSTGAGSSGTGTTRTGTGIGTDTGTGIGATGCSPGSALIARLQAGWRRFGGPRRA